MDVFNEGPQSPVRTTLRRHVVALAIAVAAVTTALTGGAHARLRYVPFDLGALPGMGPESRAWDVNDRGDVAGSTMLHGQWHAFLWTNGQGVRLLDVRNGVVSSWANAVNDARQVVGSWRDAAGVTRAFLWTEATGMIDLDAHGDFTSEASAINAAGHVVGSRRHANGSLRAFRWSPSDGMVDLGTPEGRDSVATGIGDDGVITCSLKSASGSGAMGLPATTPCVSVGDELVAVSNAAPREPTLPGSETARIIHDVNRAGQILAEDDRAVTFVWSAAQGRLDLPAGSTAVQINDRGEVAGFTTVASRARATLWRLVDKIVDGTSVTTDPQSPQPPGATMTTLTVAPSVTPPQPPGASIVWTALATGGTGPHEYRFWVQPWNGAWDIVRDWSAANTFEWRPTVSSGYNVGVEIRSTGTEGAQERAIRTFVVGP